MPRRDCLGLRALELGGLLGLMLVGACQSPQPSEVAVAVSGQALTAADCPSGYNVIVGTGFADTLNGTAGNDCIVGLGGVDTIHGNGGNDFLIGGSGNDRLYGDDGNDTIYGESDDDLLEGGNGNDTIDGSNGLDTINGGAGADALAGGNAVDTINGNDGADTIYGDVGNDIIDGGADADSLFGGDSNDTIHGGTGNDRIFGEAGTDTLYGDDGNDVIDGGGNADTIRGGAGDDAIDGDLANDILYGDEGEDALVGGAGTNTADGGSGTDACSGVNCELPQPVLTGCTLDSQCGSGKHCIVDLGLCLGCLADQDGDGVCNSADGCPNDAAKAAPGVCGCGVSDADGDSDGTANCNDGCPSDATKVAPGVCGCGVSDADSDSDGTANCHDQCPGFNDALNADGDALPDACDACPTDATDTCDDVTTFATVPGLVGVPSRATAVNANGQTLVGYRLDGSVYSAFRYNVTNGLVALTPAYAGSPNTTATGVSSDGQVIVGSSRSASSQIYRAVRWNAAGGIQAMTSSGNHLANWVAPSGSFSLGFYLAQFDAPEVFDTSMNVTSSIGPFSTYSLHRATAASDDGSVVLVNRKLDTTGVSETLLYDMQFANGYFVAHRAGTTSQNFTDLTPDGSLAVGYTAASGVNRAVTWTKAGGYVTIPGLATCASSDAVAVAKAASLQRVVGHCGTAAYLWDGTSRARTLRTVLVKLGVPLPAFSELHVTEVSRDARTLVGYGLSSAGGTEQAWVMRLGEDFDALGCSESDPDTDGVPSCYDECPSDHNKSLTGVCGCGVADTDSDSDGTPNCIDACPSNAGKIAPGICGCATSDTDSDGDGTPNCQDACPSDATKTAPGVCGCGVADADSDGDGVLNCNDGCPSNPSKIAPGACGCSFSDADSDGDGTPNCNDGCPSDPSKTAQGFCGCGVPDADGDGDGVLNCLETCPADPAKTAPGICGCGVSDANSDGDSLVNCQDGCPFDAGKTVPGICGCGVSDADPDGDGTPSCHDGCPADASKTAPGICGCGQADVDSDGDGTLDCVDECPADSNKTQYGTCGCGVSDADSDADGVADCNDACAGFPDQDDDDGDGTPNGCDAEFSCGATSSGPYVYQGSVIVYAASDSAVLTGKRCITGDVIVVSATDGALDALQNLESIAGMLVIISTELTTLDGLDALRDVGASLVVSGNRRLENLAGLRQLAHLGAEGPGSLDIDANEKLPGCWVWELERQLEHACDIGTWCNGNHGAGSCGELPEGFACVPGAVGPGVLDRDVVLGVDLGTEPDVADLGGVSCITGDVWLDSRAALAGWNAQLEGLHAIGGALTIDATPLYDLNALSNLRSIGVGLTITNNTELRTIALPALDSLGELSSDGHLLAIENNACVPESDIAALELQVGQSCGWNDASTMTCAGNGIDNCPPPQPSCAPGDHGPGIFDGDVWIYDAPSLDALAGITCVTGTLTISDSQLGDLHGLESLEMVGDQLYVGQNQSLESFDGLQNLRSVGTQLNISSNPQLNDLSALSSLSSVGDASTQPTPSTLYVFDNQSLPGCWAWMLEGQTGKACGFGGGGMGEITHCAGNQGTGSCGALPEGFECVPGAVGPGVYNGDINLSPWAYPPIDFADFGGLTCVTGSVSIYSTSYTDLSMLSTLQGVGGELLINDNMSLTNVAGLENLRSVGTQLNISNNPQLNDLSALSSLSSVGDASTQPTPSTLYVFDNQSLPGCWAWMLEGQTGKACGFGGGGMGEITHCAGNQGTGSCGALPEGFECVPGAVGPGVYNGDINLSPWAYPPIDFADFGGLTCVTGSVSIYSTSYTDLSMLSTLQGVGGELLINDNMSLTNVAGLENLRSVGTQLNISNNPQLNDLSALSSLSSVGDASTQPAPSTLYVFDNQSLPGCWAWMLEGQTGKACGFGGGGMGEITHCAGNQGTGSCGALPEGFECVPGAVGPGVYNGDINLSPWAYPPIDFADFGGLTCVTGSVSIYSTSYTDLSMLSTLQGVGGELLINDNMSLTNVAGLENLRSVGTQLNISNNPQLNDLSALSSLSSVGDASTQPAPSTLYVFDNQSLPGCWAWTLEGQTGVACGFTSGGMGEITHCAGNQGVGSCGTLPEGFECVPGAIGPGVYNGDILLSPWTYPPVNLADFGGLTCVTGAVSIYGTSYTDLTALSGLQGIGSELTITDNMQLTSVNGLENLTAIGRGLYISTNNQLENLAGLGALAQLGDGDPETDDATLYAFDNSALAPCWTDAIETQTGEQCGFLDWENTLIECAGNEGTGSCPSP